MTQEQIKQIEELTGLKLSDKSITNTVYFFRVQVIGLEIFIELKINTEKGFTLRTGQEEQPYIPKKGLIEIPKIMGWA